MAKEPGCWASCLDDCAGGISGEHIFSRNLCAQQVVIAGAHWLKGQSKTLPRDALKANVLCRHHNSALGLDADKAAGTLLRGLKEIVRLREVRLSQPHRKWSRVAMTFDGLGFERWAMKTTITSVCSGNIAGYDHWVPPDDAVRAIFGALSLSSEAGMAVNASINEKVELRDILRVGPLNVAGRHEPVGGVVGFHGFTFAVTWGVPVESVFPLRLHDGTMAKEGLRRQRGILFEDVNSEAHFVWDGRLSSDMKQQHLKLWRQYPTDEK